jgi:hypothetical protein
VFLTDEWYEAPPLALGDGRYAIVRARTPAVKLVGHKNKLLHEHAMFVLDMIAKYEHPREWRTWRFWHIPEPMYDLRIVDALPGAGGGATRVAGWAITAWALSLMLRRASRRG